MRGLEASTNPTQQDRTGSYRSTWEGCGVSNGVPLGLVLQALLEVAAHSPQENR